MSGIKDGAPSPQSLPKGGRGGCGWIFPQAGGEVVGGSSRKQEGKIKMVFPQSERGMITGKIFFEQPLTWLDIVRRW